MSLKDQVRSVADAFNMLSSMPYPSIGIDLDGTIDEAPVFFRTLTSCWPGKVFVITYRRDRAKAEHDLRLHNVRWDELILVSSFDAKACVIAEHGIGIYFDDQDEMTSNIPAAVNVFKVRNEGNFDFDEKNGSTANKPENCCRSGTALVGSPSPSSIRISIQKRLFAIQDRIQPKQ